MIKFKEKNNSVINYLIENYKIHSDSTYTIEITKYFSIARKVYSHFGLNPDKPFDSNRLTEKPYDEVKEVIDKQYSIFILQES